MIEIKTIDGRVLFGASSAKTIRDAVIVAVKARADLREADLRRANLGGANLRGADLGGADLREVDLRRADLRGAYLRGAYLRGAHLREASLSEADLGGAYLRGASLSGAHLGGADLRGADLRGADLRGAHLGGADLREASLSEADLGGADLRGAHLREVDLRRADLRGADLTDVNGLHFSRCPEVGDFIAWKSAVHTKSDDNVIVRLRIPTAASRNSTPVGSKCRAAFAEVLAIETPAGETLVDVTASSHHDHHFVYRVGETVRPDSYNPDIRLECTNGIHFFITRQEAVEYR